MRIMQVITDYIMRSILTTHGDLVVRGAAVPENLVAVAVGQVLKSGGVEATPAWGIVPLGTLSIPPHAFMPQYETVDFDYSTNELKNHAALTVQFFFAPVMLPHGATISKLVLRGYRTDAPAKLEIILYRSNFVGSATVMGTVLADWTGGYDTGEDTTIAQPVVDNDGYTYFVTVEIDPNDSVLDVKLNGVQIEWS